jgi:hypothetical protein
VVRRGALDQHWQPHPTRGSGPLAAPARPHPGASSWPDSAAGGRNCAWSWWLTLPARICNIEPDPLNASDLHALTPSHTASAMISGGKRWRL